MTAPLLDPDPRETAADEWIRLAESAGLVLDPWECLVLRVALAEDLDTALWLAFEVAIILSRQNGKGTLLEALELGWLFLLGERVLHTAQLASTANDGYDRVLGLIETTPHLKRRLGKVRRSADEFSISTTNGGYALFGPRSPRLGRGRQFDKIVYDEALFLTAEETGAQIPTMSTRDNPQVWYLSSAGREESEHLRTLRDRGRAGAPGFAYFEWSVDPQDRTIEELEEAGVLDDEQMWAQANPSLELPRANSISLEYVRGERRAMSATPALFARERLGIFDEPQVAGRVISAAQWSAIADPGVASIGAAVFAVAVNPERTSAVIVAAGWRPDGIPLVEIVSLAPVDPVGDEAIAEDPAAGLGWVIEWAEARPGARVAVAQNGPSGGLTQRLIGAGADVVKVSDQAMARASQAFYDRVLSKQLRHLGDEVLEAAVAGGRRKDIGDGGWSWHQRSSAVDIGPLQAATLAVDVLSGDGGDPVYPGFDRDAHIGSVPVEAGWERFWAVRLGSYVAPSVWQCWALDPGGVLVLEHELYRSRVAPAEFGGLVAGLTRDDDGEWTMPRPRVVLSDADPELYRAFGRAAGKSAREPAEPLEDGVMAVSRRLAEHRIVLDVDALVGVDEVLAAAHRPTCTTDELPGYVWDTDKGEPCGGHGAECLRWVVAYCDLRPRSGVRFL